MQQNYPLQASCLCYLKHTALPTAIQFQKAILEPCPDDWRFAPVDSHSGSFRGAISYSFFFFHETHRKLKRFRGAQQAALSLLRTRSSAGAQDGCVRACGCAAILPTAQLSLSRERHSPTGIWTVPVLGCRLPRLPGQPCPSVCPSIRPHTAHASWSAVWQGGPVLGPPAALGTVRASGLPSSPPWQGQAAWPRVPLPTPVLGLGCLGDPVCAVRCWVCSAALEGSFAN